MSVPIISVTGTKGKTTAVAVIDTILRELKHNVVKVDTTGHYVNGEKRSTSEDSSNTWRLVPTRSPGRYLWEFYANPELTKKGVAVLECSLGSSNLAGLGYERHKVGVFLNVFEDHLGSTDRLKTREDIAEAKSFIFRQITSDDGYAVFNADDPLVVDMLNKYAERADTKHQVAVGLDFSEIDLKKHLDDGGVAITVDNDKRIVMLKGSETTVLARLDHIPWTFYGNFLPSVWNCMFSLAAVYAVYKGTLPEGLQQIMESVRLDPYGGRVTILAAKNGTKIIADYAHEKQSLAMIADLAKTQVGKGGKVIGVVRMAYDRPDSVFEETGALIGSKFDQVIVYEKIDGYWRKAENYRIMKFRQVEGRTSQLVFDGVKRTNQNAERIEREDEAIARAAEIAGPNDVVVVIVNDDIKRSIEFIRSSFEAEFV